jgi:hypothetical protein
MTNPSESTLMEAADLFCKRTPYANGLECTVYHDQRQKNPLGSNDTDRAPTNVKESSWVHCQLCAQLFP